jgi:hypothetical protein
MNGNAYRASLGRRRRYGARPGSRYLVCPPHFSLDIRTRLW